MKSDLKEITINGVEYVAKNSVSELAEKKDNMPYVILRGNASGVFAGYLKERNGNEAILINSRRIWYWSGAATLSQLAMEGTKNPDSCKFPCEVGKHEIPDVIEVLHCTEEARKSIQGVKVWEN